MELSKQLYGSTVVVKIEGQLIQEYLDEVNSVLDSLRIDPSVKSVVLDLNGVSSMDSSGMGILVKTFKHCQEQGKKYALCGLNLSIEKYFKSTFLDKVIRIFPTLEQAMVQSTL